jgi:hypothetical protein
MNSITCNGIIWILLMSLLYIPARNVVAAFLNYHDLLLPVQMVGPGRSSLATPL